MLAFNSDGLLPPDDYPLTINDLRSSILVNGPEDVIGWDIKWRLHLVKQLEIVINQLWAVGITEIFINGSFVEDKLHPNDIDGYFVTDLMRFATGDLHKELNLLDPGIWTWDPNSRKPYRGHTKAQLPMWHKYRVELYPHCDGIYSDILDKYGNNQQFPAAFRKTRDTFQPKGIIKIIR